ncbi:MULTISPECIES: glycoside hydrolase family protein [unclassified Coleofasciculus]|uniref:glycoside hydrolase family 24 protein n=1 Tax=unclassified Coleofasciculus TaxID=2692782 RepID=UPI00188090C6|nr:MULTISPECIES: glycoside hydrolase family protein [unclassified Coleofasciculus]MBE9127599.1 glycoside hydrolase family protein [Coleofasciculus sp. LEGE 07081]MBE9150930.1 glycoside hydrolase family protein [Coleofasciculus sp. LEGE 07092]
MKGLINWVKLLVILIVLLELRAGYRPNLSIFNSPGSGNGTQPLVMKGGDPYIRALMRTISASEANVSRPYAVLYGGEYVWDLSHHPERCVPIVAGPNVGNCTTAAGRYQFINTTWYDKAKRYHPRPWEFWLWKNYSFEPQYQDAVVYAWLSDKQAWGMDISAQLQQGRLERVLRQLSGTWTSLGYGIETNAMTGYLPGIYQQMLIDELRKAGQV